MYASLTTPTPPPLFERQPIPDRFRAQSLAPESREKAPQWLKNLLNDVGYGILMLDAELRLCFCNDSARRALLQVGLDELLSGHASTEVGESSHPEFYAAAHQAAAGRRKLIMLGHGECQFAAALSPIKFSEQSLEGGVLITTERKEICESISLWAYGRVQGLTPSEIRVLEHLSGGMDPKFIASTLSVSVTTVRTHIKSMLEKTNSSSMRDLLLKIARLPPISTVPCFVRE